MRSNHNWMRGSAISLGAAQLDPLLRRPCVYYKLLVLDLETAVGRHTVDFERVWQVPFGIRMDDWEITVAPAPGAFFEPPKSIGFFQQFRPSVRRRFREIVGMPLSLEHGILETIIGEGDLLDVHYSEREGDRVMADRILLAPGYPSSD